MFPSNSDLTVVILKPDLDKRSLRAEFFRLLRENELSIVFSGLVNFDLELIRKFYQWETVLHPTHIGEYLCSVPLEFLIIRGKNAIMMALAIKTQMRSEFKADNKVTNLLHCPESPRDFIHEFSVLLGTQECAGRNIMTEIKTNNQVEAILYRRSEDGSIIFLMLKRAEKRGGFWQPITGNVKPHESFEDAALREMQEETGIAVHMGIIDTGYGYEFEDDNRTQYERVFGIEVQKDATVVLSHEHTEFRWVDKQTALGLLKYPGNKAGLEHLWLMLKPKEA